MSEDIDPVAEVPEASQSVAASSSQTAANSTVMNKLKRKQWPLFAAVGLSAVTGLAGFALGSHHDGGREHFRQEFSSGPDNRQFNGPMMPGQFNGPMMPGQQGQMMPGKNGQEGQPGQGIDPDGDNWTGGRNGVPGQPGQPGPQGQPGVAPSASPSTTS